MFCSGCSGAEAALDPRLSHPAVPSFPQTPGVRTWEGVGTHGGREERYWGRSPELRGWAPALGGVEVRPHTCVRVRMPGAQGRLPGCGTLGKFLTVKLGRKKRHPQEGHMT